MSQKITNRSKTATVTGLSGQDGSYLAKFLLNKGYKVYGVLRYATTQDLSFIKEYGLEDVEILYADLTDDNSLAKVVLQTKPDEFYHLAAQSHVGLSFNQPEYTMSVTGTSVTKILEQIRLYSPHTRFVQAGSSEQFGDAPAPQNENTPFRPRSPYAVAKVAAYYAVKVYRETYDLHASTAISFNHESPRRGKDFVTRKVTDYIGRLVNGLVKDPLLLGNLDAKRDWSAATDIVMGIWLIAQQSHPSDYVLASGETHTVRDFVSLAFERAGMPIEWRGTGENEYAVFKDTEFVAVKVDPKLYRPCEVPLLLGNFNKAKTILGWYPIIPFEGLVDWMVQSDIDRYTNDIPANKANNG